MHKLLKSTLFLAIVLILLGLVGYYLVSPKAPIISGYVARMMCTCHFVEGMSIDKLMEEDVNYSFLKYASVEVDEVQQEVNASFFGMAPRTARVYGTNGCVLLGEGQANPKYPAFTQPRVLDTMAWKTRMTASRSELDRLFFKEHDKTRAALVLIGDTIVYEQYADGITPDMALLGWSATKSVMSALIGQRISDGKLNLQEDHLFDSWTNEQASITLEDLLQMKSGLSWDEDYSDVSPATNMLYNSEDMVATASNREMEAIVGQHWEYSSGSTNLLSGILRATFDDQASYINYPYLRLFRPLGMSTAFIEMDAAGNFVGSSYMYASARDWAKFGLLYQNHGYWYGTQVLDSSWVAYTFEAEPTSGGIYGAQFWHNKDGASLPDAPHDMIYADGYQGQRIFILPKQGITIVRLGLANMDFNHLIKEIVSLNDKREL